MPKELSLPEELMQLTGLNQIDLATYIQEEPSKLSRFIDNTRPLSANSLLQMANMLIALNALPNAEPSSLTNEEKNELQSLAEISQAKCKILQKKLSTMQLRFAQGKKMLQLLPKLSLMPENNTERKIRWIEEQEYKAEKRVENNGLLPQKKLSIAIEMLQQETAAYLSSIS